MFPKLIFTLLLCLSVVEAADTNWGTVHKVSVILGTLLGGLILAAIIGFFFYYICVRKWVSDSNDRLPHSRAQVYRAPPAPIQKDIPVYTHQESVPPPSYTAAPIPSAYEHEPIPVLNQSVVTSSSFNSTGGGAPVALHEQIQNTAAPDPSNYYSQYRTTTTTTRSAAYTGSSV